MAIKVAQIRLQRSEEEQSIEDVLNKGALGEDDDGNTIQVSAPIPADSVIAVTVSPRDANHNGLLIVLYRA